MIISYLWGFFIEITLYDIQSRPLPSTKEMLFEFKTVERKMVLLTHLSYKNLLFKTYFFSLSFFLEIELKYKSTPLPPI